MTELVSPSADDVAKLDPLHAFTEQWLANRRFSDNTKLAYRRDVHDWAAWCAEHDVDPLRARFTDVNTWARDLESPMAGRRALAPATVARKVSSVSSWYGFLVKLGAIEANPAAVADRPAVDIDFSPTVAFTHEEATRMIDVAARGDDPVGPVGPVLAMWLVQMGTRATETTQVNLEDLATNQGHRVVLMTMKGGRKRQRTIPPQLAELVDHYLAVRLEHTGVTVDQIGAGLFAGADGKALNRHDVYRFVRRLARAAGVASADRITPHSFRHAWNTIARARGADLEDRQRALGHRDPRTTRRYDRSTSALARDPALLVAAAVAHPDAEDVQ